MGTPGCRNPGITTQFLLPPTTLPCPVLFLTYPALFSVQPRPVLAFRLASPHSLSSPFILSHTHISKPHTPKTPPRSRLSRLRSDLSPSESESESQRGASE